MAEWRHTLVRGGFIAFSALRPGHNRFAALAVALSYYSKRTLRAAKTELQGGKAKLQHTLLEYLPPLDNHLGYNLFDRAAIALCTLPCGKQSRRRGIIVSA
jgi:hypothetical protein